MRVETTLTLVGEMPDNVQVGDVLRLDGTVTVHTIRAEMVDASGYAGGKVFLPAVVEISAYDNDVRFAATREP